jgi:hypothetical protein
VEELAPDERASLVPLLARHQAEACSISIQGGNRQGDRLYNQQLRAVLNGLLGRLLDHPLPLSATGLAAALESYCEIPLSQIRQYQFTSQNLLKQVEQLAERQALPPELVSVLERYLPHVGHFCRRRLTRRIEILLMEAGGQPLLLDDPWAEALHADLEAMPDQVCKEWENLLRHALCIPGGRPSRAWRESSRILMMGLGEDNFVRRLRSWLKRLDTVGRALCDRSNMLLKGLFWMAVQVQDDEIGSMLGAAGAACIRRLHRHGLRAEKAGNACITALGGSDSLSMVAQLLRLRRDARLARTRWRVNRALERAAKKRVLELDELEDLLAPRFGLDSEGRCLAPLGSYTAELRLRDSDRVYLMWIDPEGRRHRAVPEILQRNHPEQITRWREKRQALSEALGEQKERLERLLWKERSWAYVDWQARFLDHPLVAHLARRLVWEFRLSERRATGVWYAGGLAGLDGEHLDWLTPEAVVRLWHPLDESVEAVLDWRRALDGWGVRQPFEQADRAVHQLSEAELETGIYSNRFAAQLLDYRRFVAYCRRSAWNYIQPNYYRGAHSRAVLPLPVAGWRAELWVETLEYNVLTSDQVRFYDRGDHLLALADVPTRVFSEAMRAVNQLVAASSQGVDPDWRDGGAGFAPQEAWRRQVFGELGDTARERKEVLARLLPRLKIAEQCAIEGDYLRVRGSRELYKIHLGSGNVLREPGERYLCIVADRSPGAPGGRLFLPFEGDEILTLILSKAFLLAADHEIRDRSILCQLDR